MRKARIALARRLAIIMHPRQFGFCCDEEAGNRRRSGAGADSSDDYPERIQRAPKKDLHLAASGNNVHLQYRPDVVDCSARI